MSRTGEKNFRVKKQLVLYTLESLKWWSIPLLFGAAWMENVILTYVEISFGGNSLIRYRQAYAKWIMEYRIILQSVKDDIGPAGNID